MLEGEITKNWKVSAAGRWEYYSDFGNRFIWKLGSRYTLFDVLTFRTTFNTGFRAPSMPQVYFSSKAFQFVSIGDHQAGRTVVHANNESYLSRQFGIEPLRAETSNNISFGIAASLFQGLSLTADLYQIDIRNRIVITGKFNAEDDLRFAEILAPLEVAQAQFFYQCH